MANGNYEIGDRFLSTRAFDLHAAVRTGAHGFRRDVAAFTVPAHASAAEAGVFAETGAAFARLGHPHVLAVDDICVDRGRTWVVARPVTGAPLSALLDVPASRARALRIGVVVQLVRRVAEAAHALSALSGAPLGGICADTVWLERNGAPLLLPAVRCPARTSVDGVQPRFAAPEARYDGVVTAASDVYGLALLLWDLLALGRAHGPRTTTDSTTEAPLSGDHALAQIVLRALSSQPADRPPHLLALRDELAALAVGSEPEPEDPVTVHAPASSSTEAESSEPRTLEVGTFDGAELAAAQERVPSLRPVRAPVRVLARPVVVAPSSSVVAPGAPVVPAAPEQAPIPCRITPSLRVVGRDAVPPVLALNHGARRWVVGRGRSADLVVLDLDMSREHFEVVLGEDGQFRLYDLGSKNGSFVNGARGDDQILRSGDRLRAGNTELRFES